jgi:hypothetical protein
MFTPLYSINTSRLFSLTHPGYMNKTKMQLTKAMTYLFLTNKFKI